MSTDIKTLLDADYITRDEKAVIRLFYKKKNSREISEIPDFEPYFYVTVDDEKNLEKLGNEIKNLQNVTKTERKQMTDIRNNIFVIKVTVKEPKDVPELREKIKELEHCKEVREAAIPFAERYIINSGLVPMENCEEISMNIAAFDMEVYNPGGEPHSDKDPIIMISYADSLGLKRVWTYKTDNLKLDFLEILKDEKEVIEKFVDTIKEQNIDIITGYNTDNFDFPYLKERAEKFKIKLEFGIDESPVKLERRGMNLGARIRGRPHVDMFPICRQVFNLSRYRLEDVFLEISGIEKPDIKVGELAGIWDSKNPEELGKLLEYSMSDAICALKIAISLLPLQYELSRITRDLIYESSRSASGQRVEALLVRKAYERNIIVPNKPSDRIAEERTRLTYAGAYVMEPEKGIHDNIVLFDFRSLYPSIIISHNIDLSTIDCECCKKDHYKSPTGHYFCKKNKGFIPEVLNEIVMKRISVKKRMKEEKDHEKKKFFDVEQQALKILANSMYGYFGFARARWYSRECAESIAALGREYIHKTISEVGKSGFKAIYSDTDSVYITKPDENSKEGILESAMKFQDKINKELPEGMELEYGGFYPRGIFITKKRYALSDEKGKLVVKGLETRRRDWAEIAKETQEAVLNAILRDKNPEKAAEIVKKAVQDIKTGRVPLKELAINTQITRGMAEYVQAGPHILAAKKAIKKGYEFKQGDIITYIVTKNGGSISDKSVIMDFVKEGDYDADYYINNQVLPAVMRILEAVGYSEDELKGFGKQMKLGGF